MIKKLLLTILLLSICSIGFADTVTYYFDAYDVGAEEWAILPGKMVDGDTAEAATTNDADVVDTQLLTGNTSDGTDLGTITKIEIRAWVSVHSALSPGVYLRPVFGGGDGDNHAVPDTLGAYIPWVDITSDTNAPGSWSWANVDDLDMDVETFTVSDIVPCGVMIVEIRVTYTPGAGPTRRIIIIN